MIQKSKKQRAESREQRKKNKTGIAVLLLPFFLILFSFFFCMSCENHWMKKLAAPLYKSCSSLGHSIDNWAETTPATCEANGVETGYCTRKNCDHTEIRPGAAALKHDYHWEICPTDPTCTTPGNTGKGECLREDCGKRVEEEEIPIDPDAHLWEEIEPESPATNITEGWTAMKKCTRDGCSAIQESETIPALPIKDSEAFAEAIAEISNSGPGDYTLNITEDITMKSSSGSTFGIGPSREITVTIKGIKKDNGDFPTITLDGTGSLFTIGNADSDAKQTVIIEDLNLKGTDLNTGSLVNISYGTFIMKGNSSVSGNTYYSDAQNPLSDGGGVRVVSFGIFIMQDNARVYGNKANQGGGVSVTNGGTFYMEGGTIYGSDESELSNTADTGAALYVGSGNNAGTAKYGDGDGEDILLVGTNYTDGTITHP